MDIISPTQKQALASKLHRLSERVDADVIDACLDEILQQIEDLKCVSCTLGGDDCALSLKSRNEAIAKVELPRAKTVLRLICARLAVRASAWANREISPHGGHIEFALPQSKQVCKVDFENTTDVQRFVIELLPLSAKNVETLAPFAKEYPGFVPKP